MRNIITLLILMLTSSNVLAVDSIQIGSEGKAFINTELNFQSPIKSELDGYLELGDSLSEQIVIISSKDKVRVSVQLETSMTISAEGPHLDLTDWKHCTTDWVLAEAKEQSVFKLPNFSGINTDCFPEVTADEIRTEVLRQGGQTWVDILEEEGLPKGYSPASISLSMVRIKIEKQVNTVWQQVTIINVSVPMGC